MVKLLAEFRKQGTVKDLIPTEKKYYEHFLDVSYKDNLNASVFLQLKFPRWSIISGYYAMHDISKLLLAKKFDIRLSAPEVHAAVIQALRELVPRKDILSLIEKAEEYEEIKSLHGALFLARDEREKSQYYTSAHVNAESPMQKSTYFLDKIVKPYIKLVNELIKSDNKPAEQ